MAYFIPSYIQKRLLRYALSRLEFLDTDALDLDKLDIAWGRKSTVELKDVALRKAKLSSILHLPEFLDLQDARISVLRLTIPADLHAASIVAELGGVEARVRLLPVPQNTKPSKPRSPGKAVRSSDRTRQRQHSPPPPPLDHDLHGHYEYESEQEDLLPDPHFLAQSFLAEEPRSQKQQLEAALASQSTDLHQSVASNDSVDDDGLAYGTDYGTGVNLDLPQFLADFLKGVIDRIQLVASEISIKLDVPLDSLSDDNVANPYSKSSAETTFGLDIEQVQLHPSDFRPQGPKVPSSTAQVRVGARCVSFTKITGSILSEVGTFSHLSEALEKSMRDRRDNVASVLSPDTSTSEPSASESYPRPPSPSMHSSQELPSVQDHLVVSTLPEEPDLSSGAISPALSESLFQDHMEHSTTSSHDPLEFQSTYDHAALQKFRQERSLSASMRSSHANTNTPVVPNTSSHESARASNISMPGMFQSTESISPLPHAATPQGPPFADHKSLSTESDQAEMDDEMVESKMYTHEEAQSMYMSAVYDTTHPKSSQSSMPGYWNEEAPPDISMVPRSPSSTREADFVSPSTHLDHKKELSAIGSQDSTHSAPVASGSPSPKPGFERIESFKPEPSAAGDATKSSAPTSSAMLSIPLFCLSGAQIWLSFPDQSGSQSNNNDQIAPGDVLSTSNIGESRHMPGSFSMYAESTASLGKSSSRLKTTLESSTLKRTEAVQDPSKQSREAIDVTIDDFSLKFDPTTCKMVVQLMNRLKPQKDDARSNFDEKLETSAQGNSVALKLHLKSFEATLDENFADRSPDISATSAASSTGLADANANSFLLRLSMNDLVTELNDIRSVTNGSLEIGRFRFGFVDEDMISFSQETKLRTSLHDVREVPGKDIRVEFNLSNAVPEINVVTQPVHVAIDLQKLDNTLGSIGGLSGLLELGSSVLSDTTVLGNTASPQQRQRTVRFEASVSSPSEKTEPRHLRVNIKIHGSTLTFRGKETSLVYQSSAIKIVTRSTLVGVQIDDMRLTGPHSSNGKIQPIVVRCWGTRLRYLFAPEEHDLTRLISLLTPSKDKFEEDDDFLVDTLIKQRKKGAVLRVNMSRVEASSPDPQAIGLLQDFGNEASKLSSVTKFLPKETRPGLMTLCAIETVSINLQSGLKLGEILLELKDVDVAHVSAPSLVAFAVGKVSMHSPQHGNLITEVFPQDGLEYQPMLMTRMIEDELDPSVRVKLWNVCLEYSVPVLVALMDMDSDVTRDELVVDLTKSVAALAEPTKPSTRGSLPLDRSQASRPLKLDFALRECAIGLSPRTMPSKAMFILNDTRILTGMPNPGQKFALKIDLRKAGMLLIDDVVHLHAAEVQQMNPVQWQKLSKCLTDNLCLQGYVSVASISAASITVSVTPSDTDLPDNLDIDFKDRLFVLETCADSTQTLIDTLNQLAPPARPSVGQKYRTEVAPVEEMMASFTGEAFAVPPMGSGAKSELDDEDYLNEGFLEELDDFEDSLETADEVLLSSNFDESSRGYFSGAIGELDNTPRQSTHSALPRRQFEEGPAGSFALGEMPPQTQATARKWDSSNNRYMPVRKSEVNLCPLKVRVTDTHIIWNLFDGYDWARTRDTITKAVQVVEAKAEERLKTRRTAIDADDDEESVIGDFLFNSIYIGVPVNADPKDLSRQINGNIDDLVSETASQTPSHTSTTTTSRPSRPSSSPRPRSHSRKLRLNRSRHHKITFELRDISVDYFAFLPGGETQSSTDIRIENVEIFDHVPTSTWKKFATYMHDAGPREDKKPMLHLEICDVRPVPELTATELVIRVTILPLRLHVDQDALDFITRFFEFNDSSKESTQAPAEQPYLQRVEVRPIPVKLDYKPKKVDYAGLRSGRTTEFMNFFNLDAAEFVLKHVVVYGTSGMLKLHHSLEDVWMPDVKKNQLPTVLSGLNGIRTFVNLGAGVRDLVAIPIQEYKKDGRIVRSISKGALAFARTTGSELTRFGAKVAVGAQTALQGAEGYLSGQSQAEEPGWEDGDLDDEEKRAISHYANHPAGILQGLKGAARSLERDLLVTRDVIVAVSGEVRESTSAEGAARAVARHAPTLILRPVIGASKAISQTLMGATNTVDPANRRRIEDKYKRY